jgi:hypothetical protein
VDVYEAQAAELQRRGQHVPAKLQTQLNAKRASLEWQNRAYDANQRPDGLERRDARAYEQGRDVGMNMLTDLRKADMSTFVLRLQREHGISKFESIQLAEKLINTDGVEPHLPNFARLAAKMGAQAQTAPAAPARKAPTSNGPDLARMAETIRRAKAAGEDTSDSEALLKYLQSQS